jgi:hypothetical protein
MKRLWILAGLLAATAGYAQTSATQPSFGVVSSQIANTFSSKQTMSAGLAVTDGLTADKVNGVLNATQYGGADLGAQINSAGAACSWNCTVYVPGGNYIATTTVLIPLNSGSNFTLQCSDGANISYTGPNYLVDTYEPGILTGTNKITIKSCHVTGTSAASGAIRLLPSGQVKIEDNIITGFSKGDAVTLAGANAVTIRGNNLSYNLNGLRFYSTKCMTTSPYTCSPTQGGSTSGYAVNALDVQANIIDSNAHWAILDDQTQGFTAQALNNSFSRNVIEANGTAGRSYGGILLSYSIGAVVEKNYFEAEPRNIVVGTGCCNNQNTVIGGNYFTTGSGTPNTIELLTAIGTIVKDNIESGSGSTCFVNQTTVLNTFFGPNTTASTNSYCVSGSLGNNSTDTVVASNAVKLNGSQSLTGVQGTTGTKIAAATGSFTSGNLRSTDANGNSVDSGLAVSGVQAKLLSGTSSRIGGSALTAGTCASTTVTVAGAATSMSVLATPTTYPGDAFDWKAYVSSANTVTIKVCTNLAAGGTPTSSTYNVRVIQ